MIDSTEDDEPLDEKPATDEALTVDEGDDALDDIEEDEDEDDDIDFDDDEDEDE